MEGSIVHVPQLRNEKDGLVCVRRGNEPSRKGHGLKCGGPACHFMVEKEWLHRLGLVVQIHYLLVLKWDRKYQEKQRPFE